MAKKSVADLEFEFNDSGELELGGFDEGDVFEEEEELLEEEEEVEEEVEEEEEEDVDTGIAARVSNIEKTLQALPQMIANALGKSGKQKEEEEDEELPEGELDNKQIINILGKRMEKAVEKRVNGIMEQNEPALKQARVTAEFQSAAIKYGERFKTNMIPVAKMMHRVEQAGGKITAEAAFLSLVDAGMISKSSAKTAQKTARKAVKVDADSKDSVGDIGSSHTPRPKMDSKKIKEMSDADMFQQSWNGALLTTAKRSRRT